MRTVARILISALVVILAASIPVTSSEARRSGHGPRVGIGVWLGPGWWGPQYYAPYYSPYPYYPYYPPEPPVVIQQQPDIYLQPAPQQELPVYWYYCKDPQGYYPYVKQCPNGWMKVVPTPPGPETTPPQ